MIEENYYFCSYNYGSNHYIFRITDISSNLLVLERLEKPYKGEIIQSITISHKSFQHDFHRVYYL